MNAPQVAQLAYEAWRLFVEATNGPSPEGEAPTAWLDLDTDVRGQYVAETEDRAREGNPMPTPENPRIVILHQVVAAFQLAEYNKRREQEVMDDGGGS